MASSFAGAVSSRPTGFLVAIAALEAVGYISTNYASMDSVSALVWAVVSAMLLWRLWKGGVVAWTILIGLAAAVLVLTGVVASGSLHTDGGIRTAVIWGVASALEVALLVTPQVRRWVGIGSPRRP